MSVITIFSGIFCKEKTVAADIAASTGYQLISDETILEQASKLSGIPAERINSAFSSKFSVFNQFTFEKERFIAYLRLAVARLLKKDGLIITGFCASLIPGRISHALRVCMIANNEFRLETAMAEQGVSRDEAGQIITGDDLCRSAWTQALFSDPDPWNPDRYDMVLPMGKTTTGKASVLIEENLLKDALRPTPASKAALDDFILESEVGTALVSAGHNVTIRSRNGALTLFINKKVLMLNRLETELNTIAAGIPGVNSVEILVEQPEQAANIYRKHDTGLPSKILLVDDEQEFVQTLSERLKMRDMGCVVAYDGESALELVHNDDPEVMIIDLKMPGIDGMEVLNRVKKIRPEIEVIILTGHGSENDRQMCMELGAFSYLQKPVDINVLGGLIKDAHDKFNSGKRIPV